MNSDLLLVLDAWLAMRLLFLGGDRPLHWRAAAGLSAAQALVLVALPLSAASLLLLATILTANLGLAAAETRRQAVADGWRCASLLLLLALASVAFGPALDPGLRPQLLALWQELGRYSLLFAGLQGLGPHKLLLVAFGALLLTLEVNFLIRLVFTVSGVVPAAINGGRAATGGDTLNAREYRAGRIIGILERNLILFFVLVNQFAAIAFIIAAKGIARFKELDEREFAEYVLIGTLLSSALAILVAALIARGLS